MSDYDADAKKNEITDGAVTLSAPRHVDVAGDRAYVVVPASVLWWMGAKSRIPGDLVRFIQDRRHEKRVQAEARHEVPLSGGA